MWVHFWLGFWVNMGVNVGEASENMLKTDTIQVTQELLALIAEID
jgi:hypothetical protein